MNLGHCYTPTSVAVLSPFPSAFLSTGHRRLPSAISEQGGEGCPAEPRFGGRAFSSSLSLTSLPTFFVAGASLTAFPPLLDTYTSSSRCIVEITFSPLPWIFMCGLDDRDGKNREQENPRLVEIVLGHVECQSLDPAISFLKTSLSLSFSSVPFQRPQDCQPLSLAPSTQFTLHTDIQHPGLTYKQMNKHLLTLGLLCEGLPCTPTRQTLLWERFVYSY